MASGVNKIIIVGNLGRDPETRYSQAGMAITNFSVAVTERTKNDDGSWGEATEWFKITCFGKTAEHCGEYLQRGRQVYIEGRLRTSKYTGKDGVEKTSVEVIANQVTFLGAGKGPGGQHEAPKNDAPGDVDDPLPF